MAYSDDSVLSKLSTLSETQDSIVATSQWLLFHRRHADRTASLWLTQLRKSPLNKRLNLIYLANEVVQQSRARGKRDFLLAFEPIIAEAAAVAYEGQGENVRGKVRRVVEVWRQRSVFDLSILDAVEARVSEIDSKKSSKSGGKLGGTLFGGGGGGDSLPAELKHVANSQAQLSKTELTKRPAVETAETEFGKLMDPGATLPTPPVRAARLSALTRNLASAQGAVEACVKARRELVEGLETLLETNRAGLNEDEATLERLSMRREGIEAKKKEVEDAIMRGLSNPPSPAGSTPVQGQTPQPTTQANGSVTIASSDDLLAPEAESFTPPPPEVESFTPELVDAEGTHTGDVGLSLDDDLGLNLDDDLNVNTTGADELQEQPLNFDEPLRFLESPPAPETNRTSFITTTTGFAALASNGVSAPLDPRNGDRVRQASTEIPGSAAATGADPRLKRRKMSHPNPSKPADWDLAADPFATGSTGVDEEGISAMLAQ